MAESFKDQVDAITGFGTTENDALSDWLTAGARLVLNAIPIHKLDRIASNENFTNTVDVEGRRILSVLRRDENNSGVAMPCRKLPPSMMGKVSDSNYMEAASTSDPAYIIYDKVLNIFPTVVSSNHSRLIAINTDITVAHGATNIDNFPDEAEWAVVLYAARQALERKVSDANTDEDMELAASYSNQYALIDSQYKEALQLLGMEEIEERKLQRDAR
tara:strand:- start:1969 stop:2619 length:651 start_codon:yes stop_codon:yes gene_type:complete